MAFIGTKPDNAKSILQYFKHSSSALAKLPESKRSLNKDQLKARCPHSVEISPLISNRLMKKKEPLVSTLALHRYKDQLEEPEWTELAHAVKVCGVLAAFNGETRETSAEAKVSLSKQTTLSR